MATLTPVQLTRDTRVMNHGFRDGVVTNREVVLQAGTAVLVDETGVPRVKCSCGNPLTDPSASDVKYEGTRWAGFAPAEVITVAAGPPASAITLSDPATGTTFSRPVGNDGTKDVLPCPDEGVLVADDEGVHLRRDCEWVTLVTEPSTRAFGDGAGGIVYQPQGSWVEAPGMGTYLGLDSPIKWIPKGESEPRVLHEAPQGGALELFDVWSVEGEPNVLYRELLPGAFEKQDVATVAVLARRPVAGGEATVLIEYSDLTPASWEGSITAGGAIVMSYSTRQGGWSASWMDPSGAEIDTPVAALGEYDGSESTWRPESLVLSPDGRAALVVLRQGGWDGPTELRIYDLSSGDVGGRGSTDEALHPTLAGLDGPSLWDFDGRRVIVSTYDYETELTTVEVVDLASGQRVPTPTGTASFLSAPGR